MKSRQFIGILGLSSLLCACNSSTVTSNSSNQASGDASKIQFINPNTVVSLPSQTNYGYVEVINTGSTAITGLNYSLGQPVGSGSGISIDPASAAACAQIAANSQCVLELVVPASSVAGSFKLSAGNHSGGNASLYNGVEIGVTQADLNNLTAQNAINTYFYSKVAAGTPYVLITGVVASSNLTPFNMVSLIDSNGNPIPGQEIVSSNLGAGLANLGFGETFAILLPAPTNTDTNQTFQLKLAEITSNGTVINQQTLATSYNLAVVTGQGIVSSLPSFINLTTAAPSQTITLLNIGDASADLQSLVSDSANVQISFNSTSLAAESTVTATVSLVDSSGNPSYSDLSLTLNNGVATTNQTINVEQSLTPPPLPQPTAGLKLAITPAELVTNTAIGSASALLTLTNSGNTTENNFQFTLPTNFSLAPANLANACTLSGNTVNTALNSSPPNNSCVVMLNYTNNQLTPRSNAEIVVNYQYNNAGSSAATKRKVDYEVTQASAILRLTPKQQDFGNILNNQQATSAIYTFELYNSGQIAATNLMLPFFSGNAANLFYQQPSPLSGTPCGSTLANGGTCIFGVQFGPTPTSGYPIADDESATMKIDYIKYPTVVGHESALLSGNVVTASTAELELTGPRVSNFFGGPGTNVDNAYTIPINTAGVFTFTYTNNGHSATNFYVTAYPQNGWLLAYMANGCGTQQNPLPTFAKDASCKVVFTLSLNVAEVANFDQGWLTANWQDPEHPNGTSQVAPTLLTYVTVIVPR